MNRQVVDRDLPVRDLPPCRARPQAPPWALSPGGHQLHPTAIHLYDKTHRVESSGWTLCNRVVPRST